MTYRINADVDVTAIARGLVSMIDDLDDPTSYRRALSLGMLPAPLMDSLERMLTDKGREIFKSQCCDPWQEISDEYPALRRTHEEMQREADAAIREWVRRVSRDVSIEILRLPESRVAV